MIKTSFRNIAVHCIFGQKIDAYSSKHISDHGTSCSGKRGLLIEITSGHTDSDVSRKKRKKLDIYLGCCQGQNSGVKNATRGNDGGDLLTTIL